MDAMRITSPRPGLAALPFYVNLATLHVERTQLDEELLKMVVDQGVTFMRDRVVDLEAADQKIRWVQTEAGVRVSSPWLIDASGIGVSLVAKKFNLPSLQYGPTKVAIWTYFRVPQQVEGTTLYMDPMPAEYLEWIWEIPVSPDTVSVGYVAPGAVLKRQREEGASVEDVFRRQLMKFSGLEPLLQQEHGRSTQRDLVPLPGLPGFSRGQLADGGRGGVSGGSHDFERSHRGASPRRRSRGTGTEIPDARGIAA